MAPPSPNNSNSNDVIANIGADSDEKSFAQQGAAAGKVWVKGFQDAIQSARLRLQTHIAQSGGMGTGTTPASRPPVMPAGQSSFPGLGKVGNPPPHPSAKVVGATGDPFGAGVMPGGTGMYPNAMMRSNRAPSYGNNPYDPYNLLRRTAAGPAPGAPGAGAGPAAGAPAGAGAGAAGRPPPVPLPPGTNPRIVQDLRRGRVQGAIRRRATVT